MLIIVIVSNNNHYWDLHDNQSCQTKNKRPTKRALIIISQSELMVGTTTTTGSDLTCLSIDEQIITHFVLTSSATIGFRMRALQDSILRSFNYRYLLEFSNLPLSFHSSQDKLQIKLQLNFHPHKSLWNPKIQDVNHMHSFHVCFGLCLNCDALLTTHVWHSPIVWSYYLTSWILSFLATFNALTDISTKRIHSPSAIFHTIQFSL